MLCVPNMFDEAFSLVLASQVDTAELVAFVEIQLMKAYTPGSGPQSPMRNLVAVVIKKLQTDDAQPVSRA